ncbi:hypothetical protein BGZ97_004318, partial [Linnemannia gamsii]
MLLFPQTCELPNPSRSSLGSSFNESITFYNARDFINLSNGTTPYENNDLFDKPITQARNGRSSLWTEKPPSTWPLSLP